MVVKTTSPHVHVASATTGGGLATVVLYFLSQWKPWAHMPAGVAAVADGLIVVACSYALGWLSIVFKVSRRTQPAQGPVDAPPKPGPMSHDGPLGGSVSHIVGEQGPELPNP